MNRVLLDIAATSMFDASLVAAQALVLNRLGIPFAAITAFSGIGAYAIAISLNGFSAFVPLILLLSIIMVAVFSALTRNLPQDQYLLLTLAALGLLRATTGSIPELGGQNGISSASSYLPPQESLQFVVVAALLFVISLLIHVLIERSEFGLSVAVARTARTDIVSTSYVRVRSVVLICFFIAFLMAVCAGAFKAMYAGRVVPQPVSDTYRGCIIDADVTGWLFAVENRSAEPVHICVSGPLFRLLRL